LNNPYDRHTAPSKFGLTTRQIHELEEALTMPARTQLDRIDAYEDIAREYEHRTALLLVANDLRGALNAAEIAVAAHALVDGRRRSDAWVEARMQQIREAEANNPLGVLVGTYNTRRRTRVKPVEPTTS